MTFNFREPLEGNVHIPSHASVTFPCKWCDGERRMIVGVIQAHTCPTYHTANEDLTYVLEQIAEVDPPPKYATLAEMREEAARAIREVNRG